MRRLRVLMALWALSCGTPEPAPAPVPAAPAPAAVAPVAPAPAPEVDRPKPLKVGEAFDVTGTFPQVWPDAGDIALATGERPTILMFWSPSSSLSREELVRFDRWVAEEHLRERADVYAVAGIRADGLDGGDVRDVAVLLGIDDLPILVDPDFLLSSRLGVQSSPEIVAIGTDKNVLGRGIKSLDHARLSSPGRPGQMTATDYLLAVAKERTGPTLPRTFPYFPSDALIGQAVPDVALTRFSAEGPTAAGEPVRLRSLLSGKRPAAVFFFSSTCRHCQVDVPQIVELVKSQPEKWDVIGVTAIKSPQHREITAKYLEQQGVTFPVLEDVGSASELFRVTSTPTTFYVSAKGTIGGVTYYQHKDLADDWARIAAKLDGVQREAAPPKPTGWAFPLTVTDETGAKVDFASFEGRPTVLHFWATWCLPCREELPKLLERIPEIEKHGRIALVSVEKDPKALERYRTQTGLDIRSYLDPQGGLADQIDFSRSVPRTYVVDEHGQLQQVLRGSWDWDEDEKLARVLDRLR